MSGYEERTSAVSSLSLNTLFYLLSNYRRRAVLAQLITHERRLTVNDLAKETVVREEDVPITDVPGDELTHVHISLQHNHIPKLAKTPLIEYDEERKIVEPTEYLEPLEPFLSPAVEADSVQSLCRNWREES